MQDVARVVQDALNRASSAESTISARLGVPSLHSPDRLINAAKR